VARNTLNSFFLYAPFIFIYASYFSFYLFISGLGYSRFSSISRAKGRASNRANLAASAYSRSYSSFTGRASASNSLGTPTSSWKTGASSGSS